MSRNSKPAAVGWKGVASRRGRVSIARNLRTLRKRSLAEWASGRDVVRTAAWFGTSTQRFESLVRSEIGLARNPIVLDVGCADGALLRDIKRITQGHVQTVGLSLVKVPTISGVDFFRRKLVDKLNEEKKYDMVFGVGIVGHSTNPVLSIQNMLNSAKVGGIICVSDFGLVSRVISHVLGVEVISRKPTSFIVRRTSSARFDLSQLIEQFDSKARQFPINRSYEALRFI